jgi:hypothetical protein
MEVNLNPDGWSDPARGELTSKQLVNNAMAKVHAADTMAFGTAM